MKDSKVTKHASKRMKERIGLGKSAQDGAAEKALKEGLCHSETTGPLKKFVDALFFKNHANQIRIYQDRAYIFKNNVLITVLPVPNHFAKIARKLLERKKVENIDCKEDAKVV